MHNYQGEANPRTMFVEGPFGAGKTTFAIQTLIAWLEAGIPPQDVLVLVPQRTLARRYLLALRDAGLGPLGDVLIRTLGGLAKDVAELYWPLAAAEMGFQDPNLPPRFLTIETAQYAMASFVEEAISRGEFEAISVSPQQIARQVIDNLGKASLMRVDYRQIPMMLSEGWGPERPRSRVLAYEAAGRVAQAYRQYCLENRLLDYALQVDLLNHLLDQPHFRADFFKQRPYLIVEHLEEESPLTHSLLRAWVPTLEGGLFTYEWDGGYRVFLGADPEGGLALREVCEGVLTLERSHIMAPGMQALEREVAYALRRPGARPEPEGSSLAFRYAHHSYYPQMIDWAAGQITHLVQDEGIPPREIVVLAPFLSDALRFSLSRRLEEQGIAVVSHRPSRALRDEPAARAMLALTALAHPSWDFRPPHADVANALQLTIQGLDPVRARLLTSVIYHPRAAADNLLTSFEQINPEMQARITYLVGERYERLRTWIEAYRVGAFDPLDHFFSRLFGEVLSQAGFGFHDDPEAGRVIAELVESARKFRTALFPGEITRQETLAEVGRRYATIVRQGLLAALYISSWRDELADAVFMAPAYTFLMRNRAARVQFWLDVGSNGWWERLDQPLTHPYVLSPSWPRGQVWSDADEYYRQQDMLYRIVSGLIRRCRERVYLAISDLGEQGFEQRGPLLRIFQAVLHRHPGHSAEGVQ